MTKKVDYGTVNFEGKELTVTQAAYVNNDGTEYHATAVDTEGKKYIVTWKTTEGWNNGEVDTEDESNACNWDNPIEVKED